PATPVPTATPSKHINNPLMKFKNSLSSSKTQLHSKIDHNLRKVRANNEDPAVAPDLSA
ncbi:hypothetical protein TNCV_3845541, partial [Trichonephila clavipes]